MAELNQSKPIATPFPKFNPQDVEIFILEAEAWFKFNQVYEQTRMINHMGSPAPSGINTCHVCKGIGHWARDCPSRRVDPLSSRPMGPKVMVTTADPFEEATDSGDVHTGSTETDPEAMDLSSYQQPMDLDHHEEEHDDDDDEGNVSGVMH
ncbi:hypothetical protein NDA11_005612 [Ustilago hordei]|nr:hypothetical protein NDA11_005612 [Ustilago hordei]